MISPDRWGCSFQFLLSRLESKIESHPIVRTLLDNLLKHIGKRRTIVSSCALYVETKRRHWALDHRLGDATAILATETIERELSKFLLEADKVKPDSNDEGNCDDPTSSFEAFLQNVRRENRPISTLGGNTDAMERSLEQARRLTHLVDSYEDNDGALAPFPKRMLAMLNTIQPTSVSAERAFSTARSCRRYNQESLDDDRFARKLFLRSFNSKTKPLAGCAGRSKINKTGKAGERRPCDGDGCCQAAEVQDEGGSSS